MRRHRTLLSLLAAMLVAATAGADDDRVVEIQSRFKATRKWFGMVSDLTFDRAADGTLSPRWSSLHSPLVIGKDRAGQSIDARMPANAARPLRVELRDAPGFWVRTSELGASPSPAEVVHGLVLYRGAVAGGDLIYKLTPTHVDEYLYLREPPSVLSRRFEFDTGPDVSAARDAGEMVELVGKDGVARLRVSAPLARGSDGVKRRGTIHVKGRVLVEEIDLRGLVPPILVDPDWTTTGSMTVAHWADGSWRRPDDKVVTVGGCALAACPQSFASSACSQVIANADVWDPKSGTWTYGPALATGRYSFASSTLPGGDFLVAGGCIESGCTKSTALAERYVWSSAQWAPAGALDAPRANSMASALPGGDVLVAGGCDANGCSASVQRYSNFGNGWSTVAPLPMPRGFATATTLSTGRVLIVGGCTNPDCATVLDDAWIYDPPTDKWTSGGTMSAKRAAHTSTLLQDGTVLVAGGCSDALCATTLASADRFRPATSDFVQAPPMAGARHNHTATALASGDVLVAGGAFPDGSTAPSAEVFRSGSQQWIMPHAMVMGRAYHTGVLLANGNVLVAGGCNPQTCLPFAEVFSPVGLGGDAGPGEVPDAGGPPVFLPPSSPHPALFRTGVTTCATNTTQDLACPVNEYALEDGDFQPNTRAFEARAGEVLDPVTRLVWQLEDGKTYDHAAALQHCGSLGAPDDAGSWRLPSVVELMTLVDYGVTGPSINRAFAGAQQTNYWTATPVSGSQKLDWTVKFDFGEVIPLLDDTSLPVRCVRGESKLLNATRKAGPLVVSGPMVVDQRSGVEWQRRDDGAKRSWREALAYCATLSLGGHDDWHLPNVAELQSIVEFGSAADAKIDPAFEDAKGDIYWTSSQNEGAPTLSWSITFNLGVVDGVTVTGAAYARCVRHLEPVAGGGGCRCNASPSAHGASESLGIAALAGVGWLVRRTRRSRKPRR